MNRRILVAITVALLLAVAASAVRADTLYLKDGRSFKGKLISDRGGVVKFKTLGGVMDFKKSDVDRIEKSKMPSDEYKDRLKETDESDFGAMLELAEWCRESRLHKQRRQVLRKILDQAPDHPEARRASGQIHDGEDWVKEPKDLEEPAVEKGDRVEVPETLASVAPPKGWKVALSAGKVVATGPARYKVPPVLTLEFGGVEAKEEAFPEKDGWEKPAKAESGLLSGLRSRRPVVVEKIDRVEAVVLLGSGKSSVRARLTVLAMESETFEKALDLALSGIEWKAPPLDYVNEHYGYGLNLPKPKEDWKANEDEDHDLIVDHKRNDVSDFARLLVITGNPGNERTTVQKWFDGILEQMKTTGDITKDEPFVLAGKKGRFVDGTYLEDGIPYRTRMVLVDLGKRLFWLVFHQHEFGAKKTNAAWDVIIESFRFTK